MGDFNAASTRWGYKATKSAGKIMEDFVDAAPLELLQNPKPTFISFKGELSRPDLAMVHIGLAPAAKLNVLESCSGSGHRALLVNCKEDRQDHQSKRMQADTEPRWNFKKADWAMYSRLTDNKIKQELIDPTNPDATYNKISTLIKTCAMQSMPRGSTRQYKPFWNENLERLKQQKDEARREAESTKTIKDNQELRRRQAALKRAVLEAKRSWYRDFVANLDYKKDGLKAFRYLATLNNESVKELNEPLRTSTGREVVDNTGKARLLAKHYASVSRINGKTKSFKVGPTIGCPTRDENFYFYSPFSMAELARAENESKTGKSAGPDNIPFELLLNVGKSAKEVLLLFFNTVWSTRVPAEWRKAEIIPILKKDKSPADPASYRPISLTSACCKLMERMVVNRLNNFLESNSVLTDFQAGFRRKRGTIEQVAYLSQWVKDGFQRMQSTIAVFIDFKAAYDTVWKPKLLEKLAKSGVRGSMFDWLKSFLTQRFARVRYQGSRSKYVQLKNGLPQGAVVSCALFNVMINDLIESLRNVRGVEALLFADDLVIFATSSHIPAITEALNAALNVLEEWCDSNLMTLNMNKTVCQLYSLSTKNHSFVLNYKNQKVNQEDVVNYLGIALDKRMTWNKHVEKMTKSAESRLRLLKRLSGITWGSSQETLSTTYKTYIRPVLEYGAELLTATPESTRNALDKVQNKALRLITGAPKSTPIPAMHIQTEIEPLKLRRDKSAILLAEKVLRLPVQHWNRHKPAAGRLSSQTSFLSGVAQLNEEYGLQPNNRLMFARDNAGDLSLRLPETDLQIGEHIKKNFEQPETLKSLAVEKVQTEYPKEAWLHIYTDGSADRDKKVAGAGFVCEGLLGGKVALGERSNNFDAEIEAVKQAALTLRTVTTDKKKAVFLIDSKAAILAMSSVNRNTNPRVHSARRTVSDLMCDGWQIAYQWVPSHCNIRGNELADRAAKEACNLAPADEPVTYEEVKAEVKEKMKKKFAAYQREKSNGKVWETLVQEKIPTTLSRKDFTANFRMATNHDYLQAHLCRIGVKSRPACPLCGNGEDMTSEHIQRCPKIVLNDFPTDKWRRKGQIYWAARREMDLLS